MKIFKFIVAHLVALIIFPAMLRRTHQIHGAFDGHFEHVLSGTDSMMDCLVCDAIKPPLAEKG